MLIRRLSALVGVLVLSMPFVAPPALADDATTQPEAVNPVSVSGDEDAVKAPPEKKVCKKEASTGSVIPKKVCRTPSQIKAEQDAARRNMEHVNDGQERPTQSGG